MPRTWPLVESSTASDEDGSTTPNMTTSDQSLSSDLLGPAPEGTVAPKIRGRLRSRLPGRVRTARGQLIVLAGFLFLSAFTFGMIWLLGGGQKMNLPPTELAAFTVIPLVFGALCVLAGRLLLRRSWVGYWLAMALGFIAVASGTWAIVRVITGAQGLAGDPGFFFCVYQGIHVLLGAAILVNLVGLVRSLATSSGKLIGPPTVSTSISATSGSGRRPPPRPGPSRDGLAAEGAAEALEVAGVAGGAGVAGPAAVAVHAQPLPAVPPSKTGAEPLLAVRGLKKHFPIVRRPDAAPDRDGLRRRRRRLRRLRPARSSASWASPAAARRRSVGPSSSSRRRRPGRSSSTATSSPKWTPTTCGRCGAGCRSSSRTRSVR